MSLTNLSKLFREQLGISISSVLLPKEDIDIKKWSVVACDQFTSEPEYWAEAGKIAGSDYSTLHIIFPEVYLEHETDIQKTERIHRINQKMREYMGSKLFREFNDAMVLVERETALSAPRKGLVFAVDLERYDYSAGSQSLIRATEGTIVDRLPPRIRVRENASIESPHIMLLIDDPLKTVIEPIFAKRNTLRKLYDFSLMLDGGGIKGYLANDYELLESVYSALLSLSMPETFYEKYGVGSGNGVLLFAAGDGNHSLATAKACWEKLKEDLTESDKDDHPARYALVEVVNVHDEGLSFEPIHRLLFNVNSRDFIDKFILWYEQMGISVKIAVNDSDAGTDSHIIRYVSPEGDGYIIVKNPNLNLAVGTLQQFIDWYVRNNPETQVDYVHGDSIVDKLGRKENNMGFFLEAMDKNDLFKTVILDGSLPRKTFSMGEAQEKRYYLECRKITR